MKLEVHTFDPELINILMSKPSVLEGEVLELNGDARLIYVRTFSGRVKHFPRIIHFEVELLNNDGPRTVSRWFFERAEGRSIERVMVDYQDIRMDIDRMKSLLDRAR